MDIFLCGTTGLLMIRHPSQQFWVNIFSGIYIKWWEMKCGYFDPINRHMFDPCVLYELSHPGIGPSSTRWNPGLLPGFMRIWRNAHDLSIPATSLNNGWHPHQNLCIHFFVKLSVDMQDSFLLLQTRSTTPQGAIYACETSCNSPEFHPRCFFATFQYFT